VEIKFDIVSVIAIEMPCHIRMLRECMVSHPPPPLHCSQTTQQLPLPIASHKNTTEHKALISTETVQSACLSQHA